MKHIFFITLFAVAGFGLNAQNLITYSPAADTITNTESDTLTFTPTLKNYDFVWQVAMSESISGTDSLTVTLQESSDNSYWYAVGSSNTIHSSNLVDEHSGTLYGKYHRLIITGIGTQSTEYTAVAVYRRKD